MKFIKDKKYFFLFLFWGMCIFAYSMISSGFQKIPGDFGDTRFVCYNLEHYFLFLNQVEPHTSFWDMGIFYPMANNTAYSDLHIGLALIYIPVRFFIHNPFTVFQITFLFACILNFLSFYLLINKCFKYNDLSSAIGAFIFAFSVTRYAQAVHLQLMGQFPMIFGLYFLFKIFTEEQKKYKYLNALLSAILFALQFWTAFYFSYFLILMFAISMIIVLYFKDYRKDFINILWKNKFVVAFFLVIALILSLPLALKYHVAIPVVNKNFNYGVSVAFLSNFNNWFENVGFLNNLFIPFTKSNNMETSLNCGILTMICGFIGIFLYKKYRKLILILISMLLLIFSFFPIFTLCYKLLPAFSSIRASGRVALMILPLISIGIAKFAETLKNKKYVLAVIITLICLEQIPNVAFCKFTKAQNTQRIEQYQLNPNCKILLLDYTHISNGKFDMDYETDAMWVALKYRIKTFNGYSGYIPQRPFVFTEGICYIKAK